jgi:hypothetical protein
LVHDLIAEVRNGNLGTIGGPSGGNASGKRTSIVVGVALSVLIHVIGLWLVIGRSPLVIKPPALGQERIVVSLVPQATEAPVQSKMPAPADSRPKSSLQSPPPRTPAKRTAPRPKQSRKPVIAGNAAPAVIPKTMPATPQPDVPHREMSVPDDMFTQLEAARKRRADANANAEERASQAGSRSSQEGESQRTNSVALANIAESLKGLNGTRRDNAGGVFQVRHLGVHNAEFMFYGWSASSRRNSTRLVSVEQGAEVDIEIAVVKKMIEIIREEKPDTFVWESHRLGKQLTLSARPEDRAELEQFLIQEFFPDYIRSAPAGANRSGRG